jgi:hypothetical protein
MFAVFGFDLFLPPPPVGVCSAPIRVTLLVLADQDAKTHAGPAVTFVAKLMETEDFGLDVALGERWRRHHGCRTRNRHGDRYG